MEPGQCGRCRAGMTHRLLILAAAAFAGLAVASTALAKGASQARISGPGLGKPSVLKGDAGGDAPSGSKLGTIAMSTGFFPAVFGQQPDPMTAEPPKGKLGPKYRIDYVMPGPNNTTSTISQDLYPYATPYPLSYTKPDQRYWGNRRSRGGGVGAPVQLRPGPVSAGLAQPPPAAPPPARSGRRSPAARVAPAAA